MRIRALSDLHVEFRENLELIRDLARHRHREDVLIVAGDISHNLTRLRDVLAWLRDAFEKLFFVPGNHDLWILGPDGDSLEKFSSVLEVCASLDVSVYPEVAGRGEGAVCIIPLFSWYTRPEEGPDSLYKVKAGESGSLDMWADSFRIRWPSLDGAIPTEHFLGLNRAPPDTDCPRVTFSHFLPRQDLMFPVSFAGGGGDPAPEFNFSRVAGSTLLEDQIRALRPRVHVYGHQHRDRSRLVDDIWYVSHCLGYPKERTVSGQADKGPITIWDDGGVRRISLAVE
jgi:predicted phosphodiesterase